ncbi:hypothetical protein Bca4012_039981 [Brassica carinata]
MFTEQQNELVDSAAEMIMVLSHTEKYKNCDFGRCPRVFCCGQSRLPAGQSHRPYPQIEHCESILPKMRRCIVSAI